MLDRHKFAEWQLHDLEEETSKLANKQVQSPVGLVNNEEHMKDHHERLKLMSNKAWAKNQSNDIQGVRAWLHFCKVLEWRKIG